MIIKSGSSHNYICVYFLFVASFIINIANLSCSYCSDESEHEDCPSRDGVQNKILSHFQNATFIQLKPIVRNEEEEEDNSDCETLDIENDERIKFFFVETSQRDHLRKYYQK